MDIKLSTYMKWAGINRYKASYNAEHGNYDIFNAHKINNRWYLDSQSIGEHYAKEYARINVSIYDDYTLERCKEFKDKMFDLGYAYKLLSQYPEEFKQITECLTNEYEKCNKLFNDYIEQYKNKIVSELEELNAQN